MKRGLVLESTELYSSTEWAGRLGRVHRELDRLGLEWALVYGDVSASDDIAYLVNVCVYWNEGVLMIPRAGAPVFVTKLSPRVFPWMQRTSTTDRFRSGPDITKNISAVVGEVGRIGIVDEARWPTALRAQVSAALGERLVVVDDLISSARAKASDAEVTMLRATGEQIADALATAPSLADAELALRLYGCTDVLIDGHGTSVDLSVQFGPLWLRAGRDSGPLADAAMIALGRAASALRAGATVDYLAQAITGPEGTHVEVRLVDKLQFTGLGELAECTTALAGHVVAVVIDLVGPDAAATVADTYLITPEGARALTSHNGGA